MLSRNYRVNPQSDVVVMATRPRSGAFALSAGGSGSLTNLRPEVSAEGSTG